jgi:AGCS family alanine or glycine:cation symporter
MKVLQEFFEIIERYIWGYPLLFIIFGVGFYLTWILKGIQFRYFFYSLKLAFSRDDGKGDGDVSNFQALMIALAAMIGIGSITGVATGIAIGGMGSLFWMWIAAFFGMSTKYAEGVLGVVYRKIDKKKEMCGGPMYYLEHGAKSKFL